MHIPKITNPFLLRVSEGDFGTVNEYNFNNMEQSQPDNSHYDRRWSALETSCIYGHQDLFSGFLDISQQAKDYVQRHSDYFLKLATEGGSINIIQSIFSVCNNHTGSLLKYYHLARAIEKGHANTAEWILGFKSVKSKAHFECNLCLNHAVTINDFNLTKKLLEIPSVLNFFFSQWGGTPLSLSVINGSIDMFKFLLGFEDVHQMGAGYFESAVNSAAQYGRAEMLNTLINTGLAYPSLSDNYALRIASLKGKKNIVEILLNVSEVKKNIGARSSEALMYAHDNEHYEIAYILASAQWPEGLDSYNSKREYLPTIRKGKQLAIATQELELIHMFATEKPGGIPGSLSELYRADGDTARTYNKGIEFAVPNIIEFLLGKRPQYRRARDFAYRFNAMAGLKSEMRFHHLSRYSALQSLAFKPSYELALKIYNNRSSRGNSHNSTNRKQVNCKRLTM